MKALIPLAVVALLSAGCSGSDSSETGGAAGQAAGGHGGTGGQGGAAGAATAGGGGVGGAELCDPDATCSCAGDTEPNAVCDDDLVVTRCECIDDEGKSDHDALSACSPGDACAPASAQHIEGGDPFAMNGVECVVTALQNAQPGAYEYTVDHSHSQGSDETKYQLYVTASGQVRVAAVDTSTGQNLSTSGTYFGQTFHPARRCDLKPPNFFTACLTELAQGTSGNDYPESAWDCVAPTTLAEPPWFENCVDEAPVCD